MDVFQCINLHVNLISINVKQAILIGLDPQASGALIMTIYSMIISLVFPLGVEIGRINNMRYGVGILLNHNNFSHTF